MRKLKEHINPRQSMTGRFIAAYGVIALGLVGLVWAFWRPKEPAADFSFCNGTEIKTVDPALVTGQPEGRVVWAIFEGLTTYDPKTLAPRPGVAESWEVSKDKRVYTFHLRKNAYWSDGTPLTAEDFHWSFRRLLHPETASEYAYELWYVVNAEKYTSGQVEVGDPVEIELNEKPPGARPYASGVILRGRLVAIEAGPTGRMENQAEASPVYVVEIDGRKEYFQKPEREGQPPRDPRARPYRWLLFDFEHVGIKVLDRFTLQMTLNHPVPYFLQIIGFFPMMPVPRHCLEKYGYPAWTKPENIVSNGPFVLQYRRIRDRIRLVKNPWYWDRENVRLNTVDVLAAESAITGLNLYMTGAADWIPVVPNEVVGELLRQKRKDFQPAPYLAVEYYIVNTRRPPLDDPRVRRALALAIDKREIINRILQTGQEPAMSFVPPSIANYIPYQPPQMPEYDPATARRLLAEAGYPGGRGFPKIEILYNTHESHQAIAELVQAQWKRNLGINVRLQNQDWARYLASRRQGEFWVARAGWIADYLDPNTFLEMMTTGNPNNHGGWSNAEYDRLISRAQVEVDEQRRLALFKEAETLLLEEMPILPLYFPVTRAMVRPYVRGYYGNVLDIHPLKDIWVDVSKKSGKTADQ
ncbi:Oligopeptide ABC transporter, periplasmic oligopeptide-binding protein OppA [Thermogutta terrifontis]|uniref:Oligopeptide ABC transporter, periplasmic oligopeptide-binding protein OppA n=2 Tax=Thermogutta terrifontis TaxID=1331910 RepID=A0A286RE13_9BACT|nr:Oligopeptide ABC transporter, periplasmic oligopeptide-binding protein OppA [Thermogutta terrifontis]